MQAPYTVPLAAHLLLRESEADVDVHEERLLARVREAQVDAVGRHPVDLALPSLQRPPGRGVCGAGPLGSREPGQWQAAAAHENSTTLFLYV